MSKDQTFGVKGTKLTPESIVFGIGVNEDGEKIVNVNRKAVMRQACSYLEKEVKEFEKRTDAWPIAEIKDIEQYTFLKKLERLTGYLGVPYHGENAHPLDVTLPLSILRGEGDAEHGRKILYAMGASDETIKNVIDDLNADYARKLQEELKEIGKKPPQTHNEWDIRHIEQARAMAKPVTPEQLDIALSYIPKAAQAVVKQDLTNNAAHIAKINGRVTGALAGVFATALTLFAAQKFMGDDCDASTIPQMPVAEQMVSEPAP